MTKKRTSKVWEHFTKYSIKETVKCRLCQAVLGSKNGSTSTMQRHMKRIHGVDLLHPTGEKQAAALIKRPIEEQILKLRIKDMLF